MITKILTAILLISTSTYGQQNNFDCEKTLRKEPYFARHVAPASVDSLQMDLEILFDCGNLDSLDRELLTLPMLGTFMIGLVSDGKEITYSTILARLNEFKKTEIYSKLRDATLASKTLENKIATVDGFESDKALLLRAGFPNSELNDLKNFIQSSTSQELTYKEVITKYTATKRSVQTPTSKKFEFNQFIDIESAIQIGQENKQRVLLYFSGYMCVNARKVEELILTDSQVKALLSEKFSCFIAYTDDHRTDTATGSTLGEKFALLQIQHFKANYQPYFCIIDDKGKVLSEIGHTKNVEEFMEFLKKGLI